MIGSAVAGAVVGAGAVGLAWGTSGSSPKAAHAVSASASPSAGTFTLTGSLTLTGTTDSTADGGCVGRGGYNDIAEGTGVTVYDAAGQVVATGSLGPGLRAGGACDFAVAVVNVPDGAKFYQVEVSHRGKLTLSAQDAEAGNLRATLG